MAEAFRSVSRSGMLSRTMTPKQQLDGFIDKFDPAHAREMRGALVRVRRLTPGAVEMVYDNSNALVVGFSPTERPSDAILSIVLFPRTIGIAFLQAVKSRLPDPGKRLRGGGTVTRHVRLESAADLDDPEVVALIRAALARARVRMDPKQKRKLIVRAVVGKQRARRVEEKGKR